MFEEFFQSRKFGTILCKVGYENARDEIKRINGSSNDLVSLEISIVYNEHMLTVVGPGPKIELFKEFLRKTKSIFLQSKSFYGFHHSSLSALAPRLRNQLNNFEFRTPKLQVLSCYSGGEITRDECKGLVVQGTFNRVHFENCVKKAIPQTDIFVDFS